MAQESTSRVIVTSSDEGKPFVFRLKKYLKENLYVVTLIVAIILGLIVGLLMRLRPEPYSKREKMYAGFLGSLLLRMLKCITIPVFTTSVMSALGHLNMKTSGLIGLRTILYFFGTSFLSTILGCIIVLAIEPGAGSSMAKPTDMKPREVTVEDTFLDIIRNMFPSNIVGACIHSHTTLLIPPAPGNKTIPTSEWDFKVDHVDPSSNFLGLIVVSAAIGMSMGYLGENVRLFRDFIENVNDLFINVTFLIIIVSAPGVFSLILGQVIEVEDFHQALKDLGLYTLCCLIGLLIIALIITPVIYTIFMRKLAFRFLLQSTPVMATAFATASSLATMPTTLRCAEETNHVDPRVSRFVIPLGATVNMNGAALYNTIGPLFLAEVAKRKLYFADYLVVCLTATLASVGAAAIPQAGIVSMLMVMTIIRVPLDLIGYVYTMDWLLDRVCTAVNVMGDLAAAIIVEKFSAKQLFVEPKLLPPT